MSRAFHVETPRLCVAGCGRRLEFANELEAGAACVACARAGRPELVDLSPFTRLAGPGRLRQLLTMGTIARPMNMLLELPARYQRYVVD